MSATWQGVPTFATDDLVTAANLTKYLANNPEYLLNSRAYTQSLYVPGSNVGITGAGFASFANIDATNLKLTHTPISTRVEVHAYIYLGRSAGVAAIFIDWYNGSVRAGDSTNGLFRTADVLSTVASPFFYHIVGYFIGLTPSTPYTFTLQAKLTTTTDNFRYSNTSSPIQLFAKDF